LFFLLDLVIALLDQFFGIELVSVNVLKLLKHTSVVFENLVVDFGVLRSDLRIEESVLHFYFLRMSHSEGGNFIGQTAQGGIVSRSEALLNQILLLISVFVENC